MSKEAGSVAQLAMSLPGMHEVLGWLARTTGTRCGGTHLESEHLGGRDGKIRSSRLLSGI